MTNLERLRIGKFLQKYGVPILIGALLAMALVFTSIQTDNLTPANRPFADRDASEKKSRFGTSLPLTPAAARTNRPTRTPIAVVNAVENTEASDTPAGGIVTLPATMPTVVENPEASAMPTAGEITQPTRTPTTVKNTQPAEKKVTIGNGTVLQEPRTRHTATRLNNGEIMLAGGSSATDDHLFNVDTFNLDTGATHQLAPLYTERHDHSATLLPDGRVLVIGGYTLPDGWLDDAEIYDPEIDSWSVMYPITSHGTAHTATLLNDGRVLVIGGCTDDSDCTELVEIFDPHTDSWTDAASLDYDLSGHTAQLLEDGRVLVIGGISNGGRYAGGDALLYDPETDTWTATRPMVQPRSWAQSVRLSDGRVLVAGGLSTQARPELRTITSAEIYDPATNAWSAAADLAQPRYAFLLIKLPDGQVLAIGGSRDYESNWNDGSFVSEIERYDPAANRWHVAGLLPQPGAFAACALLPDGRIWLTGGRNKTTYFDETWLISTSP